MSYCDANDCYQVIDYAKNWTTDEWAGYGILTFADPNPHYATSFAVGWRVIGQWADESYHGRGNVATDGDVTGTYVNPDENVIGLKNANILDTGWYSRPSASDEALRVLQFEARSSSETECLTIGRRLASIGYEHHAYADLLFPYELDVYDDVVGLRIYVQASNRHANQTTGISVNIWQHDYPNDDGSGIWEPLTSISPLSEITEVDDDGTGRVWGIFDEIFEISTGTNDDYHNMAANNWGYYIYDQHRGQSDGVGGYEKGDLIVHGIRLRIYCEDRNDFDRGSGMNLGHIYVQIIRGGGETNQYPIVGNLPQALRTSQATLLTYAMAGDFYIIAPSAQIIFDDFDNVSYGATDYSFTFTDNTATDMFIGSEFYGLTHLAILDILKEAGHYMWYYDSALQSLVIDDRADLTDSGITFDNTILTPDNCTISYPKRQVIDKIILKGNPTLNLTYTKTSDDTAINQSTRVYFESLPHVTTYGELRKIGLNLLARYGNLFPSITVSIPYTSSYSSIKLGTSVDVVYSTVDQQFGVNGGMRVQRIVYKFEAGKGLYVTYYLGNPMSPDPIRIRDEINKVARRVNEIYTRTSYIDYNTGDFVLASSGGGSGGAENLYYVQTDGQVPMTADWNVGGFDIQAYYLRIDGGTSYSVELQATPTANRTFTFPDADVIIADYGADPAIIFHTDIDQTILYKETESSGGTANRMKIHFDVPAGTYSGLYDIALQLDGSTVLSAIGTGDGAGGTTVRYLYLYADVYMQTASIYLPDSEAVYFGALPDLRIWHDGSNSVITNSTGSLSLDNLTRTVEVNSATAIFDLTSQFKIRDPNDANVDLFTFNTQATRTMYVGSSADPVKSDFVGDIIFDTQTGTSRVYVSRIGEEFAQSMSMYVDDANVYFELNQDEDATHLCQWDTGDSDFPDQWQYLWKINADNHFLIVHDAITSYKKFSINQDNTNLTIGVGEDLYLYHNGTHSFITNQTGNLYITTTADGASPAHIVNDTHGIFYIRDLDDGSVSLFTLDTGGRTLQIGQAADEIVTTLNGYMDIIRPDDLPIEIEITSTEDANLIIEGDRDNDDEAQHAWFSAYQDGRQRWMHVGVGEWGNDNYAFMAGYDGIQFLVGTTFAGATQYLGITANNILITTANLLMDGSGTDDERFRLPYLTAVPGSADNGSIWMEADGIHGWFAGSEGIWTPTGPHTLDSGTHTDVTSITEAKGMILWWDSAQWDGVTPAGTVGHVLTCTNVDGTFAWQATGPADNLGDHTATEDLKMATWDITGLDSITMTGAIATVTNLTMTGQLDMTGASALIDFNFTTPPTAGGADDALISITQSGTAARSAATTDALFGIDWTGTLNCVPAGGGTLIGLWVDMSSGTFNDAGGGQTVIGLEVDGPANYAAGTFDIGARFTGDARSVDICDTTYAVNVTGESLFTGAITGTSTFLLGGVLTLGDADNATWIEMQDSGGTARLELGVGASSEGLIHALHNMYFATDTDNNSTSANFVWQTDAIPPAGTLLMQLTDEASLIVYGNLEVHGDSIHQLLELCDDDATNTTNAASYCMFQGTSAHTNLGYVGFGTTANADLYLNNYIGHIRLTTTAGLNCYIVGGNSTLGIIDASSSYTRLEPYADHLILYDGASSQSLSCYMDGSHGLRITGHNTNSYIDAFGASNSLDIRVSSNDLLRLTATSFQFVQSGSIIDATTCYLDILSSGNNDCWLGFGNSGAQTHTIGMDGLSDDYIYIGDGTTPSLSGNGILVDGTSIGGGPAIRAGTDNDHTIFFDPEADTIRFSAGDGVSDYDLKLLSTGTGDTNLELRVASSGGTSVHKYGMLGTATYAWNHMYCYSAWDDNGVLGNFDEHDDLALIDAIDVQYEAEFEEDELGRPKRDDTTRGYKYLKDAQDKIQYKLDGDGKKIVRRDIEGNAIIDPSTLPEFLNKDGFSKPSNIAAFGIGAIKQLHTKVKDQETVIGLQGEKILELEARLDAL